MVNKVFHWAVIALTSTASLSWARLHDSAGQAQQGQQNLRARITEVSGHPVTYDHGYPIHPFGRCAYVETDTVSATFYCRRGYYCTTDKHCWEKNIKEQHPRLENTQDYELDFLLQSSGHASGGTVDVRAHTDHNRLLGPEVEGMVPVLGYSYVINRREGRCNFNNYICDQGYICTEFNYCILESKAAGVQPCPNHRDHELSGLIEQGKIRPGSAGGQHGCNEEDGSCTIYECEEEYYHYSRTETHSSRPNPKKCHGRSTPTTTTKQRSSHYSSTRATQHRPAGNYGSPQQGSSYECIECEKYKNTKITRGSTPSHTPTSHQPQSHHDSSYECVECEKYKHTKTTKVTTPTHRPNSKRPQSHHSGSYECTECEEYQNTKITRGSTPSHTPNPQQPRTSQRGHSQTSQHGVFSQSTTITKTEYKKYCMGDQECMTCMTQYSVKVEMQVECIMGAYSRVKQPRRTNGLVNTIKNFAQDVYSLFNRYRNDYSASRVLNAFDKQIAKKNQRIQKLEHDNSRKGDLSDMRKQELSELVDSRNLFKSSRDQFDHLSRTV